MISKAVDGSSGRFNLLSGYAAPRPAWTAANLSGAGRSSRTTQRQHGQEFALPVLHGFEPECAAGEVLHKSLAAAIPSTAVRPPRRASFPMQCSVKLNRTTARTQSPANDRKESSHRPPRLTGQGVGPGSMRFCFCARVQRPRFGRTALAQADRQQNVHPHLQELALPVLERGADEVPGSQVSARNRSARVRARPVPGCARDAPQLPGPQ